MAETNETMNEKLKAFLLTLGKQTPVVLVLLGLSYIFYDENKEYRAKNDARMIVLEEQASQCTSYKLELLIEQLNRNTEFLERLDRKSE